MRRGVSVSKAFLKDESARISLNLFNFMNTFHCIRIPDFTSIFKLGANKHFVAIDFTFCEQGDKVLLSKPRVLLALLDIFVTCLSQLRSLYIVTR